MTKFNNCSAEPVWDENDDLEDMMDAVLRTPGLRNSCFCNPDCSWAMFIGNMTNRDRNIFTALKKNRRLAVIFITFMVLVIAGTVFCSTFFAAGDPISVVNNLSNFIFSLIRAIGLILLGLGIMQVGLSLKSYYPTQRANGFLTLAGGIIITFTKEILNLIVG